MLVVCIDSETTVVVYIASLFVKLEIRLERVDIISNNHEWLEFSIRFRDNYVVSTQVFCSVRFIVFKSERGGWHICLSFLIVVVNSDCTSIRICCDNIKPFIIVYITDCHDSLPIKVRCGGVVKANINFKITYKTIRNEKCILTLVRCMPKEIWAEIVECVCLVCRLSISRDASCNTR